MRAIPPRPADAPIPDLPEGDWSPSAQRWWETVHRSAIADEWEPDDLLVTERALSLIEDLARLETSETPPEVRLRLKVAISTELRQLESALGLGPRGRAQLKVEVQRSEDAEQRRSWRPASKGTDELAERRRELREKLSQ